MSTASLGHNGFSGRKVRIKVLGDRLYSNGVEVGYVKDGDAFYSDGRLMKHLAPKKEDAIPLPPVTTSHQSPTLSKRQAVAGLAIAATFLLGFIGFVALRASSKAPTRETTPTAVSQSDSSADGWKIEYRVMDYADYYRPGLPRIKVTVTGTPKGTERFALLLQHPDDRMEVLGNITAANMSTGLFQTDIVVDEGCTLVLKNLETARIIATKRIVP